MGGMKRVHRLPAWIRLARAAAYDTPLGAKASAILRHLEEWQELSRLLSVEELCGYLLDETGYGAFCRALPGGKQRAANLAALVERAAAV